MNPTKNNGAELAATSATPTAEQTNNILPRDPKTLRRWLAYKLTPRADGSVEKSPINIATGGFAASNDPSTWAEYADARAYCVANPDHVLGFALGKDVGLTVVDFDKVRKPGEPLPQWVLDEQEKLDSFNEDSCSGTGAHTWCWATIPANRNNQRAHVEIHDSARMFAVSDSFADNWQKIQTRDVSELWRRIDRSEIGPDYKPKFVIHAYDSAKFRECCADKWGEYFSSRSDAVGSVLVTLAWKHEYDHEKMRREFESTALCEAWEDKWKRRDEQELEGACRRAHEWEAQGKRQPAPLTFEFPAVDGTDFDFVLAPAPGEMDGLFPLGDFSLIGGASGANKTTWALQMLTAQKRGEPVQGHATFRRPFLLLLEDRGPRALRRTLLRMRLDEKDVPHTSMPASAAGRPGLAVKVAVEEWYREHGVMPQIVLVEGLDLLVKDAGKMDTTSHALKELQDVCAHYHLAVIGTTGAPKMKPKEQYVNYRERIFGSITWGRKAETIVALSCVTNDAAPERLLVFLLRNAPPEKYDLAMVGGRLAPRIEAPETDVLVLWCQQQDDWWTREDAVVAMTEAASMGRSTTLSRLAALLKDRKLDTRYDPAGGKAQQLRWRRVAAEEPEPDEALATV